MIMLKGPRAFFDIGNIALGQIQANLVESIGGTAERIGMVPGEVAWDKCDCGLLAATMRRQWLSDDFPEGQFAQSIVRSSPCNLPWLVGELRFQLIRCSPSPQGDDISPSVNSLSDAAEILISDAHIVTNTLVDVMCELKETDQIIDYTIGELDTLGPDGGCVGSEQIVFVSVYRS